MLVIVEGCDRTGKSSLIADNAGMRDTVMHFEKPRSASATQEYVGPLANYRPGTGVDVWCDRYHLGEMVWPRFFGRESIMTPVDRLLIEMFLEQRGALCVLAWRDPASLEEACADEPCDGFAARAQAAFTRLTQSSHVSWWHYQHGDDPSRLIEHARQSERRVVDRLGNRPTLPPTVDWIA